MIEKTVYENEGNDMSWVVGQTRICPVVRLEGVYYVSIYNPEIKDAQVINPEALEAIIEDSQLMAFFYGMTLTEDGFSSTGKKYVSSTGYEEA